MKVAFCIFSGTGNTLRVAGQLVLELSRLGIGAEIFTVAKNCPVPDLSAFDVLVAGFPVHAFNAPAPMLKFLKRLPKKKKSEKRKSAYILRVSGEPVRLNEASGIVPRRILKKRGYIVRGEFGYVMPYNIIFRHSDGMAARMRHALELGAPHDARSIAEETGVIPRVDVLKRFAAFALRIEHPAMPVVGRTFRVNKNICIGCGKCAKVCPQHNIAFKNGIPKFGGACAACMACVFDCPTDAIRPSLLNGWRVNGSYGFDGVPAADEEICSYCKKAYLRYFHEKENL